MPLTYGSEHRTAIDSRRIRGHGAGAGARLADGERRRSRRVEAAVTVFAALMVTVHVVPETVSHPLQPAKVDPPAAVAVRVTLVPLLYGSEQSAPQLIPAGLELTVPAAGARLADREDELRRCGRKWR